MGKNRGLWDNIHAKRKRIAAGSGERMRSKGDAGAPTEAALKASQSKANGGRIKHQREEGTMKKGYKCGGKAKMADGGIAEAMPEIAQGLAAVKDLTQRMKPRAVVDGMGDDEMDNAMGITRSQMSGGGYRKGGRVY